MHSTVPAEKPVGLRLRHLAIPAAGWGELHLDRAEPHVGKEWTVHCSCVRVSRMPER